MTKNFGSTTIKGFYLDAENNFEKMPFECVTAYTRANATARKYAAESLGVSEQFIVVTELKNEKAKPFSWDVPSIMKDFVLLDAAPKNDREHTIVKYSVYDYTADVFGYCDNAPKADTITYYDCSYKATKGDARNIVKTHALELSYFDEVVYVSKARIDEYTRYACIPNEVVEQYKKYVTK